jgi:predicted ester cyclase
MCAAGRPPSVFVSPDHGAGVEPGFANVRGFYQGFFAAFTGSTLRFDDVFASEDRVACRFVVEAIHGGPFNGLPATGKRIVLPGITILRFVEGKCVERWSQADFLGLLTQLGALPQPG